MTLFKIVNCRFFLYNRHPTLIDINQNKGCFLCCSKSCGQLITDLLIKLQDLCPFPALFLFSSGPHPVLFLSSSADLFLSSSSPFPALFLSSLCPLHVLYCPLPDLFLSSSFPLLSSSEPLPDLFLSSSCHLPVIFLSSS